MDIVEFEKMVKKDFKISRENLNEKLYKIPNLHSKYLKFFYQISNSLIDLENEKDLLYAKKRKYYLNEVSEEIKPNHVDFFIKGDKEYADIVKKFKKKELQLKVIEEALKRSNTISFFIKNIIEYEQFITGG